MRASDADRDAVLAELSEHFRAGRLTSDELEERTGQALQARTFGDLAGLMADLPPSASAVPAAGPSVSPAIRPGRAWPPALVPVMLALVTVAIVVSALIGSGAGLGGWHPWWLIFVVPLVARRIARGRRH
jgi:hypothetical protein